MNHHGVAADLAPTGVLRVSINLGNPVLAQGSPTAPTGVTVDLARDLGRHLGLPVELNCVDAARKSLDAVVNGDADLCFLAIDPARADRIAFSPAYALTEGVYAVPQESPIHTLEEVDRAGVRVGVKEGSAYDLFLSRELHDAELVRGVEGTTVFVEQGLEVAAGIREPVTALVASDPGLRLLEGAFMQIRQAIGVSTTRSENTISYVRNYVEERKADGFVAAALTRSGQTVAVAPPQ